MIYPEYEAYKERFLEAQKIFNEALLEKERLFTMTQPNAIRYDQDKVQVSPTGSILDSYVIALEESGIDDKLETVRQLFEDRERLLSLKERDLRLSRNKYDRIYVMRFLDGMHPNKIARILNYSRSQVYRMLQNINKNTKNGGNNNEKNVCIGTNER